MNAAALGLPAPASSWKRLCQLREPRKTWRNCWPRSSALLRITRKTWAKGTGGALGGPQLSWPMCQGGTVCAGGGRV